MILLVLVKCMSKTQKVTKRSSSQIQNSSRVISSYFFFVFFCFVFVILAFSFFFFFCFVLVILSFQYLLFLFCSFVLVILSFSFLLSSFYFCFCFVSFVVKTFLLFFPIKHFSSSSKESMLLKIGVRKYRIFQILF